MANTFDDPDHGEAPCTHCRVLTPADMLVTDDRPPFGGRLCPRCDDELTAEEHDDLGCSCSACMSVRRYPAQQPALRVVGFNPALRPLLGALLSDDELADNDNDDQRRAAE